MIVALWRSKSTFETLEIIFAALTTACSALTAALPLDRKQLPATVTCVLAFLLALSKWRSKIIGEVERASKAEREQNQERTWSKAIETHKQESEAEKQKYLDEVAAIRERSEKQLRTAIKTILADFHDRYFNQETDEEKHKHRTTLFTCVECTGNSTRGKRLVI